MTLRMPRFIKIGFKLCPREGIEWVGRQIHEQENKSVLGLTY